MYEHDRELARKVAQGQRSVRIVGTRGGIRRLNWREVEYLRELNERLEDRESGRLDGERDSLGGLHRD